MVDIRIRFDAVRAKQFDDRAVRFELIKVMGEFGNDLIKEYHKTTETWTRHPRFYRNLSTIAESKTKIEVWVHTPDVVWNAIDQGVPPRELPAQKEGKSGTWGTFSAKTIPGVLTSLPGGKVHTPGKYFSLNWNIPWSGIEARNWSELIKQENELELEERIQIALNHSATNCWKES